MNYEELKLLPLDSAILTTQEDGFIVDKYTESQFPSRPEVIVFGDNYWRTNEGIAKFINTFVSPDSKECIAAFFNDIVFAICSDPALHNSKIREQISPAYVLMYDSYKKMFKHPDALSDWCENKATFMWYEFILSRKRADKYKSIIKEHDADKLREISKKIQSIYGFSDLEIIYLQYFCSQSKLDNLDSSLNTFLYIWSKEKCTGKSTVSEYLCGFLNGENGKNADEHKSDLAREMQMKRFDIPAAVTSRCTFLDEAAFSDMAKTYNRLKNMITSNTCNIEYKYKNSQRPKRCYRNYILTSNDDPIYFVKDDSERRILTIHFKVPEKMSFDKLNALWYEFVLQCNLSCDALDALYHNVIKPNSQEGESSHIMVEMMDVFSRNRIHNCSETTTFSVSNVMTIPEVITQRLSRQLVKEVLIRLYGQPDKYQRFYKINRLQKYNFEDVAEMAEVFNIDNKKTEQVLPFEQ